MKTKSSDKTRSCSKEARNHSGDPEIQTGEESLSVNPFPSEDLQSNIQFLSATGELEWLIEALKEKCVHVPCTVQLERLYSPTVSQFCSQTTYSSCLGPSSIDYSCQTSEPFNLQLSGSKTNASIQSGDTWSQSPSVQYVRTSHNMDGRNGFLMDAQLPANGHQHAAVGEDQTSQMKNGCLMRKCSVKIKKQSLAQMNEQQPKDTETEHSNNVVDLEELSHSGEHGDIKSVSKTGEYNSPEEEDALALADRLKEDCLSNKIVIKMKRLSSLQLKELRQSRHGGHTPPPEVLDSSSDDQIKHHLLSDDNSHSNEDTCAPTAALELNTLTSSEDLLMPDQEMLKAYNVPHKRNRTSEAPGDKRSTSTARPGTGRKVCVSGLSVNRWKNKDASSFHTVRNTTAHGGGTRAVDCSISEMIPAKSRKHNQTKVRAAHASPEWTFITRSLLIILISLKNNPH